MRAVLLTTGGKFKTTDVIRCVAEQPSNPRSGIPIPEMRKWIIILDSLDKLNDGAAVLLLEDADHGYLVHLLNSFEGFIMGSREMSFFTCPGQMSPGRRS